MHPVGESLGLLWNAAIVAVPGGFPEDVLLLKLEKE